MNPLAKNRIGTTGIEVTALGLGGTSHGNMYKLLPEADALDVLAEADNQGLVGLKGHRSVGGMRASIYNAMSEAGVAALVDFMKEFERQRG